jgi:hypothetical protein
MDVILHASVFWRKKGNSDDTHLSFHASFCAGTISACISSPHNQPDVPHQGALDGTGARSWLAARAGITYTFPDAESAKTRDSETCTLVIFCCEKELADGDG